MNVKKGDMLWVTLKHASNEYGYGEVTEVWEEGEIGVCFEFFCQVNGGLRMGLEKNIIDKPNLRMTSKLFEQRKLYSEMLKKKKK